MTSNSAYDQLSFMNHSHHWIVNNITHTILGTISHILFKLFEHLRRQILD